MGLWKGVVGVWVQRCTPLHARLALGMVVVYLFFIGGLPFQNDRVLLFVQPFVVLLLFPAFVRAVHWATA